MLEGPGYTLNQLKAVQDWVLERQLQTVPGVIDVTGFGGTVKQYQVLLDTQLMRQYDVTLQMVTDAISQSNANVGGDVLPLGDQSHNVRAIGYLGEGVDSLDPAGPIAPTRSRSKSWKTFRMSSSPLTRACRFTSSRLPGWSSAISRGWGWSAGTVRTTSSKASS